MVHGDSDDYVRPSIQSVALTVANFADSRKISATHLILSMKMILFKSFDWRGHLESCVGLGDIEAAFDNARVVVLCEMR